MLRLRPVIPNECEESPSIFSYTCHPEAPSEGSPVERSVVAYRKAPNAVMLRLPPKHHLLHALLPNDRRSTHREILPRAAPIVRKTSFISENPSGKRGRGHCGRRVAALRALPYAMFLQPFGQFFTSTTINACHVEAPAETSPAERSAPVRGRLIFLYGIIFDT